MIYYWHLLSIFQKLSIILVWMKSLNEKSMFYRMLHVSFQFWIDTKTGQNSSKSLNKQSFPKDMPCSGQSHCYRSNLFGNKICRLHVKWRWLVYTCIPVHVFHWKNWFVCCLWWNKFYHKFYIFEIKLCCVQQSERPRTFADWTIENDVRDIV